MASRFVIVGAGALGSILAAHLVRAGHDVTLLARGERAERLRQDGLRLTGLLALEARCRVVTDPRELRATDTLVVATKAIATAETLAGLRHLALESAFSVQNGVIKNELLGAAFGPQRVLGCMADFSGELLPNGDVKFTRNVGLHLGEIGASTSDRARALVALLEAAGIRASVSADIRVREWSKFVGWVAQLPLAVLTRRLTWEFLTDSHAASVIVKLARETKALADAAGIAIEDAPPLPVASMASATDAEAARLVGAVGRRYRDTAPEHRMSAQQDALRGRPLELAETLGFALERAAELGVAMPALTLIYGVLQASFPSAADPR